VAAEDELTAKLEPALARARTEATDLLQRATRRPPPPQTPPPPPPPPGEHGSARVVGGGDIAAALREISDFAARHPGKTIEVTWRVVP
jgi:hypothetical protein